MKARTTRLTHILDKQPWHCAQPKYYVQVNDHIERDFFFLTLMYNHMASVHFFQFGLSPKSHAVHIRGNW